MSDSPPSEPPQRRSVVPGVLLLIFIGVYLAEWHFGRGRLTREHFIASTFALSLGGLQQGQLWQLFTYQFMHGGPVHLLLNCLGLTIVGWAAESLLGRRRMLVYFLAGGVAAGLVQCLVWSARLSPSGVMVGASGSLMALMGAVCRFDWRRKMRVFIFFLIPATVTGRATFLILTVIEIAGLFVRQSPFAHWAHLGGLFAGALLLSLFGPWNANEEAAQERVANLPDQS